MPSEQPKWYFEPVSPMGGATGSAFANALSGAKMPPEEELAREAIQNSCDATQQDTKTKIAFRILEMEGSDRDEFVQTLALGEGFTERQKKLKLSKECWLSKPDKPLQVIYIEDYGTVGLGGNPHSADSNFNKLLLSLGDVSKASSSSPTGGSFGYGKAALSMNSRMKTIVAYSVFKEEGDQESSRLMGCAYFDPHQFNDQYYTGRAWFAVQKESDKPIYSPLDGQSAHDIAERLGFKPRTDTDLGTSLLIVDSDLDVDKLVGGIEKWWWPKIIDLELEIEISVNGTPRYPKPKQREDLKPFIECYSLAGGTSHTTGSHQKSNDLNRVGNLNLGRYGLEILTDDVANKLDDHGLLGCVALMRIPKMIVEYEKVTNRITPPAVGVFIAHQDVDEILRLSEPPTHDRWDQDSKRLQLAEPDENTAREIVRGVRNRLRNQIRNLQSAAEPPVPPEEQRIRSLERLFGSIFRTGVGGGGDGGMTYPIEVNYREGPVAVAISDTKLITEASAAIRLKDDATDDEIDALLRISVSILEADHGADGDLLPINVYFDHRANEIEEIASVDGERRYNVRLSKESWIVLSVRSEPYDMAWATKMKIELEPSEG